MSAPVVFISYSHKDEPDPFLEPGKDRWLSYVQSFLKMGEVGGNLTVWDDTKTDGGGDWLSDILHAIQSCSICVLLVSRHSLTSEFIQRTEIREILEQQSDRHLRIFPIVVTPIDLETASWLSKLNLRPKNGTALSLYPSAERDQVMVDIAREIRESLGHTIRAIDSPSLKSGFSARKITHSNNMTAPRRIRGNDLRRRRQQIEDLIVNDEIHVALKRLIDLADDFAPSRRIEAVGICARHRLFTRGGENVPLAPYQIDPLMEIFVYPALSMLSSIEEQLSAR